MAIKKGFSIEDSTGETWVPSTKNAIEEIKRLRNLGRRKIVVKELIKAKYGFKEGKRVNPDKLIKKRR